MITVKLQGGLGNLLFQVSTACSLARDLAEEVILDPSDHYLPLQGCKIEKYRENIFRNLQFKKIKTEKLSRYVEPSFQFQPIPKEKDQKLVGYFQSEKYFVHHRQYLLELFRVKNQILEKIKQSYTLSFNGLVSIHVRRGDYLKLQAVHPPCDVAYYKQAIERFPDRQFLIFSDDPDWCRTVFKDSRFQVIEEDELISFYMMSMCSHNIIANSSFSWWGAWLNNNSDKIVVAPKRWFGSRNLNNTRDLIPEGWITA